MQVKRQKKFHLTGYQRRLLEEIIFLNLPTSVLQIVVKLVLPDILYYIGDGATDQCLDVYHNLKPYVDIFLPDFFLIEDNSRVPICVLKKTSSSDALRLYCDNDVSAITFSYVRRMRLYTFNWQINSIDMAMEACKDFEKYLDYKNRFWIA